MDDLDRAKDLEMRQRREALERQLAAGRELELPRYRDGVRVCLDCDAPIPAARLAARPESVRCIDCKTDRERMNRSA